MDTAYELPKVARPAISDEVYGILKNKIFRRELEPGQRLDLVAMEKELGVSRTPLKMALQRLELEGLIEIKPQSGTYVTAPTQEEIIELLEMRGLLEIGAAGLAAKKMGASEAQQLQNIVDEMRSIGRQANFNRDFGHLLELDNRLHSLIINSVGNRYLKRFWEQVNARFRATAHRYRRTEQELFDAITDHDKLTKALLARDEAEARRLMEAHIERAKELLLKDLDRLA